MILDQRECALNGRISDSRRDASGNASLRMVVGAPVVADHLVRDFGSHACAEVLLNQMQRQICRATSAGTRDDTPVGDEELIRDGLHARIIVSEFLKVKMMYAAPRPIEYARARQDKTRRAQAHDGRTVFVGAPNKLYQLALNTPVSGCQSAHYDEILALRYRAQRFQGVTSSAAGANGH